jgi:hypothetical protein
MYIRKSEVIFKIFPVEFGRVERRFPQSTGVSSSTSYRMLSHDRLWILKVSWPQRDVIIWGSDSPFVEGSLLSDIDIYQISQNSTRENTLEHHPN